MNKSKVNYFVDVLLAISFLIVTITGIFKWPSIRHNFGYVYEIVSPYLMTRIHDLSGAIMAFLVLVHLILHWTWIKSMTKQIFGRAPTGVPSSGKVKK